MDIEKLKYPIGKYEAPEIITPVHINQWIKEIISYPQRLKQVLANISSEQLAQPYRPDGWTGLQVIHHLADSHMNAYIRFHLTLTEDTPTIKPYMEERWAQLDYIKDTPTVLSLELLKNLHARWAILLNSLTEEDFKRQYHHPQYDYTIPLDKVLGLYAWHGNHHLHHIKLLMK